MRALIATATLALVAACSGPQSTEVSGDNDGILVSLSVTPADFRVGDSVTVRLTAINRDSRPRTIVANECPLPIVVTSTDGEVLGPGERICTAIALTKELGPDEAFMLDLQWSGDAMRTAKHPAGVLAPGQYYIQGSLPYDKGIAESPRVAIRIVPD